MFDKLNFDNKEEKHSGGHSVLKSRPCSPTISCPRLANSVDFECCNARERLAFACWANRAWLLRIPAGYSHAKAAQRLTKDQLVWLHARPCLVLSWCWAGLWSPSDFGWLEPGPYNFYGVAGAWNLGFRFHIHSLWGKRVEPLSRLDYQRLLKTVTHFEFS